MASMLQRQTLRDIRQNPMLARSEGRENSCLYRQKSSVEMLVLLLLSLGSCTLASSAMATRCISILLRPLRTVTMLKRSDVEQKKKSTAVPMIRNDDRVGNNCIVQPINKMSSILNSTETIVSGTSLSLFYLFSKSTTHLRCAPARNMKPNPVSISESKRTLSVGMLGHNRCKQ